MITQIGKTGKNILEFTGVENLDKKEDLIKDLDVSNLGSTYMELRQDANGIKDIYILNADFNKVITWYKI